VAQDFTATIQVASLRAAYGCALRPSLAFEFSMTTSSSIKVRLQVGIPYEAERSENLHIATTGWALERVDTLVNSVHRLKYSLY